MLDDIATLIMSDFRFHAVPAETALMRMLFAAVLGAAIGLEREFNAAAAGLRTHILVAMAAALFTLVSFEIIAMVEAADQSAAVRQTTDPLRLIEAVTAGVAFLAAGSIITSGGKVKGLTTGAGMWMAGAIGLACGTGRLALAIMATVLAVAVLWLLRRVSQKIADEAEDDAGDPGRT